MKHAYLIMAHSDPYNLKTLLKLLDNKNNDIFIHIDKNSTDIDFEEIKDILKQSNITFVKREKVYWGTYTQITAIKNLMIEASKTYHDYYHTLTGADLPIQTQDVIHNFFEKNKGKEFVAFAKNYNKETIHQANFFVKYFRSKNKNIALWARRLKKILIKLQILLKIDLMQSYDKEIKKGCDWYSITHDAVLYLLKEEPNFKKYFSRGIHVGEFFVQTILYNSKFKNNIYNFNDENISCQRYIDWDNGVYQNPQFTFRMKDYENLVASDLMFARKFNSTIDIEVINLIYKNYKNIKEY